MLVRGPGSVRVLPRLEALTTFLVLRMLVRVEVVLGRMGKGERGRRVPRPSVIVRSDPCPTARMLRSVGHVHSPVKKERKRAVSRRAEVVGEGLCHGGSARTVIGQEERERSSSLPPLHRPPHSRKNVNVGGIDPGRQQLGEVAEARVQQSADGETRSGSSWSFGAEAEQSSQATLLSSRALQSLDTKSHAETERSRDMTRLGGRLQHEIKQQHSRPRCETENPTKEPTPSSPCIERPTFAPLRPSPSSQTQSCRPHTSSRTAPVQSQSNQRWR